MTYENLKILHNCPNKQCDSDPIPTWLLKECCALLVATITNIVNLSLSSGNFHHTLKESVISPLLKKPTLDKDELSNYRPISNLFLISKIIERVVKCLSDHLTSNDVLNPHQSAYWFGIHGTVLNWFGSYLSSRCFRVKCNNDFSSPHNCLCGVSQGSVLGPLLFVMYTTQLSTLVLTLSLNHHLHADDTQLFLFFPSINFPLQHHSLTERSTTDLFLDDYQFSHSQLF